jgi:magnesium transporter
VLDTQIGPKLLGAVDVHLAARVIKAQAMPRAAELLGALDAQQAVKILRRYHHDLRDALLSAVPIERALALRSMLLWPPGSVAAHMSTEPLSLGPTTTAEQAVEQIRDRIATLRDDADAGSCVYVTGPEQQLL